MKKRRRYFHKIHGMAVATPCLCRTECSATEYTVISSTSSYPDKAVVEEEAHEGGAHGAVLGDDPLGDVAHRGLSLRARAAVEVVLQRRLCPRRRAQRSSHGERHEQRGLVAS